MRIQSWSIRRAVLCGLSLGACVLGTRAAAAEVTLVEKDGWSFFTEGRVNTFVSQGFGDDFPRPSPNPNIDPTTMMAPSHSVVGPTGAAGHDTTQEDANNKLFAERMRNGFVGSILGFGIRRQISDSTTVKGYVALWGHAETFGRDRIQDQIGPTKPGLSTSHGFDVREGYVDFEGPWGGLIAGRMLGLFGRMSTDIDFNYGHNYGLGFPCGTDDQGPTCGHIGTGVMFPGFSAGFMYSTPSLAGFKLQVGIYDPVHTLGAWNRAPIARPEGALSFEQKLSPTAMFKLDVEGLYQPLARKVASPTDPNLEQDITDKAWGVAGGGRIEVGPVRFGAAGFRGKGLSQYFALMNSPIAFDPISYEIRSFTGLYAQAAVVLGPAQISAGLGRVTVDLLDSDKSTDFSPLKSQTGASVAFYYSLSENLVLGIDYFRFQADWYGALNSAYDATTGNVVALPGVLTPERQVVHYVNVGATFHW